MRPKVFETPREWYECLQAGAAAVRRPYALQQFKRPGLPRLTVYHIPSFRDCFGWSVYQIRRESDYQLQTVIWRQVADARRMDDLKQGRVVKTSPQPTLEESIADLDAAWFERQLGALAAIQIPLGTRRPIGCDGESFGVRIDREFEVEWWCDGPPEWAELAKWTHECIAVFRRTT